MTKSNQVSFIVPFPIQTRFFSIKLPFLVGLIALIFCGLTFTGCPNESASPSLPAPSAHTHQWGEWTIISTASETEDGIETITCTVCGETKETRTIAYATGTAGLAFEAIGSPVIAYRVRKGTVTGGEVHIPAMHRPDDDSDYLPVTEIGSASDIANANAAFYQCAGITAVHIPASVTFIGNYAFAACTGLTGITIPVSVTAIGNYVFSGCASLTGITIPAGITSISERTFSGCTSLTSIIIPAGITSIGNYAYYGCPNLTTVTFAAGSLLETIGNAAFANCTSLTGITTPAGVTSIGSEIFSGCTNLAEVTIPSGVTSIGQDAFNRCSSLTSIAIPAGVTSIGRSAFYRCTNLATVTFAAGSRLETIGNDVFSDCGSLTEITIPSGVTSIGEWAFYNCTGITDITIYRSVTKVHNSAFYNWTSSQTIYIEGHTSESAADTAWGGTGWRSFCNAVRVYSMGVSTIATPIWREGDAISHAAPTVTFPAGQTVTAQGWQVSDTGSGGWTNFTTPSTADMSWNGKFLRYYAASSNGQTSYSNTVTIWVISQTASLEREVTIAMWDNGNNGWDNNAALRINVNGTNRATNARLASGRGPGYYTFNVVIGDVVQIYWVNGGTNDVQCAFAVYYSEDPPDPMFNPSTGTTGGKVLASLKYNDPPYPYAKGDGKLMGSFTVVP